MTRGYSEDHVMKLILHLLNDDQPTGPRFARIDQWSGRALCAPRTALPEVLRRQELDGPTVYFLIAPNPGRGSPRVYVGEADGFLDRIRSHHESKDWWRTLVAFYSADGSLTKSGIQYLESVLLKRLREAGWCQLDNITSPRLPTIPEEDEGGLEAFARNVEILMPVLGYNLFAEAPAEEADLADVAPIEPEVPARSEFDTIVCPAWQDGFDSAFLGQHAWWGVRIAEANLSRIRYIAIYQVAPISAITHYGEVDRIEQLTGERDDAGKYKLFLKGEPVALERPIGLGENPYLRPQGPRYTRLDAILAAKTLADVFAAR